MLQPLVDLLKHNITPLPLITDPSFSSNFHKLLSSKSSPRIVLIGDASHGTHEFYAARAQLTQHLISKHGFNCVAVEADFPDAECIDRYVRRRYGHTTSLAVNEPKTEAFQRFPRWMWRNVEVHDFVAWLREHNKGKHAKSPESVGFYGLDLYSMGASMQAVIQYLEHVDPKMAAMARKRYGALQPWVEHPQEYGLAALTGSFKDCERDVLRMLKELLERRIEYSSHAEDGDEFHGSEQNARVVADAETYYKAMYYSSTASWNMRDTHMFDTLSRILTHRGPKSKVVVWAHNSHLGDARATSMGWNRKELNLGQLIREAFPGEVLSIGMGTHSGTVAAADSWDADLQVMPINPSLPDSYEALFHSVGTPSFLLDLRDGACDEKLREELMKKRLERFIGVIYRPDTERQSHYSHAMLPKQFDAFVWFDETKAVHALEVHQPKTPLEFDETYPFGL